MTPRPPASTVPSGAHVPSGMGLLALTVGCEKAKSTKDATPPTGVVVAEVVQRTVAIVRDFTARTEAIPTVEVRARVATE